jgi:hypothetical protein
MATDTRFFAVALSYRAGEPRVDVVIKAQSEQNAASLASHLVRQGGGAVAFAYSGDFASARPDDAAILARFGVVPDDRTLFGQFGGFGTQLRRGVSNAPDHSTTKSRLACRLANPLPRRPSLAKERELSRGKNGRLSLAVAWMAAIAAALCASSLLVINARAAQREARLVEMARPTCDHSGVTNKELHHLVRSEFQAGVNKREAFYAVVEHCLTKRQASDNPVDRSDESATSG